MKIKYYRRLKNKARLSDIFQLLKDCDHEFVPPLSARNSTVQSDLNVSGGGGEPIEYFNIIKEQSFFTAEEDGRIVAFMSFRRNYVSEEIPPSMCPNIYITTVIVSPEKRNRGITNKFYRAIFAKFGAVDIFTRTWSQNGAHIRILSSLKFYEYVRKENDRGPGIDTVYYHHTPTKKGILRTITQYKLTGNLIFLFLLTVFSVTFVLTWIFTDGGMMHELSIAFATSLIASALCLFSDSLLKYRDSVNDDYINNLKSFGIENLRFRKDELLESIIPGCRHEIWITGYRLIMTGKKQFRASLRRACSHTRGLRVRMLLVPPWSETYRLVYGEDDMASITENYEKIFSDLCESVTDDGTDLEIRFTDKPVFNDTYKVDDRFITSPYMHCVDANNGRIMAKDFFSLDINDPQKRLYHLIYDDYTAVWDESPYRLDKELFRAKISDRENEFYALDPRGRCELLKS